MGAPGAVVAEEELVEQAVQQLIDHRSQHIEDAVKGRQGQDVAGEHGAESGEGEEEQAQAGEGNQPGPQSGQGPAPAAHGQKGQLDHGGEHRHRPLGKEEHGQPRQVLGDEQGLPPQGEGVGPTGGAVVI